MSGLFDQITNYSPPLLTAGQVNYKGTWDASANSPALVNPPAGTTKGDYYVVSVAGTQFSITFAVGDWIISNGTAWEKVDLTDSVSSVFGRTGAVVGASTDYSSVGLTNTAIGASSPSTGAFTTVTASSTIAATGAVTGSNLSGTHSGTSSGTNTGDQTIALTGGVTGSGTGSFAATVVTNANLTGAITSVGNATSLGSFSSANLSAALTDETGSGAAVFATSPTLVSPALGTPSAIVLTNASGTASININGTVGATTASTGAFTTLSATSTISTSAGNITALNGILQVGSGSKQLYLRTLTGVNRIDSYDNPITATQPLTINSSIMRMAIADTDRAVLDSTGLAVTGALSCTGALSKGSGSFRIEHPLPEKAATHQLVHSFIEGPRADLIYRGKVVLVDGKASVNIDTAATMTEGTFDVLCRDVQCFTTNESGWTAVRGKVTGNILTIEAKDADCTDEISWMVIGERQDPHIMDTNWTDENGRPIVEPLKPAEPALESK